MTSKATKVFNILKKANHPADDADESFNKKVKNSRAQSILKKKFNMNGLIANDVRITGGVYHDQTNKL